MNPECYPITMLPQTSRLFLDFLERPDALAPFYVRGAYAESWAGEAVDFDRSKRAQLADLLTEQNRSFGAGEAAMANIERLRTGASAVVSGQQVVLFGGPLLTLLKAATAIRKAQDASAAGYPHVPIFWLASEDHDLDEAGHLELPTRHEVRTLRWDGGHTGAARPVGNLQLGESIVPLLDEAGALLGPGPWLEDLERAYTPEATFGSAFGRWIASVFAEHGLIVIDASTRAFHALGAETLRRAITDADRLAGRLLDRDRELAAAGYHSQVLVAPGSSLLFLLDEETGARLPLRRERSQGVSSREPDAGATDAQGGEWKAGKKSYSTRELLAILDAAPERLSPNALLRPVFQDTILPTASYVGGPAEIAYFAQSQVLYEAILGRTTPVSPRLSATLVEAPVAAAMARFGVTLPDFFRLSPDELAQRVGARSIPVEGKQMMARAGNALDEELTALTGWMQALDADLGRSAAVSASKMRYQMNRLRRLAANFQLQRDASLRRHVDALYLALYPDRHPQERVLGGAWFLARYGPGLPLLLVEHASQQCPGHKLIYL
ncbi:MAG TPA: bacillithiol biosynthesis cysteine-adding enzyme BshC [Acidisarcina sp.]